MSAIHALVVEDAKIPQKLTVMILESLQCQIDTAETGKEALDLTKEHHYDIIFMDLGLPDIDGFTVTKKIRERKKNLDPSIIIALTAHKEESMRKQAFEAGMDDFIIKPLTEAKAKEIFEKYNLK